MRGSKIRFNIRKNRVRSKISRTSDRLRLSVFKSGKHLYAQVIDDSRSITLASASTLDKTICNVGGSNCNVKSAMLVGELIAKKSLELGITTVVFDKSGYKYHGIVKALAEGARKKLKF